MRLHDSIIGILLGILALAVLITVSRYPGIPGQDIGPAAFPGLLGSLLLLCSVILVWRGLRDRQTAWVQFGDWLRSPRHLRSFLLVIAGLFFYIQTADLLGFVVCSLVILLTLFFSLGVRLIAALPVAVAVTLFVHTVFYNFLRVPLPWGVLQPIAW
jgi:putative tricarboxylic transport membrane protein